MIDFTDAYSFTLSESGTLDLNLSIVMTEDMDPLITLILYKGSISFSSELLTLGGFDNEFDERTHLDAGTYYISIDYGKTNTTYQFGLQFTPDTANTTSITNTTSSSTTNDTSMESVQESMGLPVPISPWYFLHLVVMPLLRKRFKI